MTSRDDIFPVVIIGGGLAGLTAALHLAQRGLTPLVLEADQLWAGGRLSGGEPDTFDYNGQRWAFPSEHGIHGLWGGYVNMRATLERFLDLALIPSDGEEWINRWRREVRRVEAGTAVRSRWLPAPFHYLQLLLRPRFWRTIAPWDFLSLPGFLVSILWTIGFDPIAEGVALDGLLMKEFFRGWTPNLRATFVGLGKNLLAAPAENISLTAFIAALRFYTMLRADTWFPHYFPADAHTSLIAPMIATLDALEGGLMPGITALALERAGDAWRVRVEDAQRMGQRSLYARHVIVALSPEAAQSVLCAGASTAAEAQKLRFPATLRCNTVRLWFACAPQKGTIGGMFTGDFAFDNFFWLHRMHAPFGAWHAQTGGSAIELHLYGTDAQLDEPDKVLIVRALDEVQRAFPEVRGSFVYGAVRRNSKNHPQFRVPTHDSLFVETPWNQVYACGDWIGFPTPALWMERSCVTAIAAANRVLALEGREQYPLLTPPPPSVLVRGLAALVYGGRRLFTPPLRALAGLRRKKV
ncbi:MAG: NAD(P)-binding protein [Chloroflexi bacterium]|nr:NAD(P)-binding protein [Chloroflexota bacterium]